MPDGDACGLAVLLGELPASPGLHSVPNGCKKDDMKIHKILEERRRRRAAVEQSLEGQDDALIDQGIEAYKRDRKRLLAERKEDQLVAYRGDQQLAVAPTYEKLQRLLHKRGTTDEGGLFITHVVPGEEEECPGLGR